MQDLSILQVEGLSIVIGEQKILEDVNFSVQQGEFVGIIGANGAGKSTLLKTLRGLQQRQTMQGAVKVFGQAIHAYSEKEIARKVAYMQQEVNLGFGFSALQIVLTGRYPYLSWWQNESKKDYEIARQYMRFTGVSQLENKKVNQMSGGERQRVLLAKVLAQEAPLIYLDEPTASLDLAYQEEIFRYCQMLCQQGKTILIIVHDIRLAAKFCSRLLLVGKQRILADGTPEEVITKENLRDGFGLHAAVYYNIVGDTLDIHTFAKVKNQFTNRKVQLVGGAGTSGELIRLLGQAESEIYITGLSENTLEGYIAHSFGVKQMYAQDAEYLILNTPYLNEENISLLEQMQKVKSVIIIEDTPGLQMDLMNGHAIELYQRLKARATVMSRCSFIDCYFK